MIIVHPVYNEAVEADLISVGHYRETGRNVRLCADAATALNNLMAHARKSGIAIVPVSGFRTVAYQTALWDKAVAKHGSIEAAGRWVARPGHSEHHTGLAVDLGEAEHPECDVETPFEETRAFQWLELNAERFGYELSYPRNNARGINYEPWHWRFIGTPEAKQIFHHTNSSP
jgi:D-alanyl-D-alanine carboxypeptidase